MKVLFVYTNVNGFHEDNYAFGLASISAVIKQAGPTVKFLLLSSHEDFPRLLDEIASFEPRVVGFSSVSSQFSFIKELSFSVKKANPKIITVCGGVHCTIYPQSVCEVPGLDGIFVGESEWAFKEFLEKIDNNQDYHQCDNFAYCQDSQLVLNPLKPLIEDLDVLPPPDRDSYPFGESIEKIGYVQFRFTRGCPYMCTYCSNHALAKRYGLKNNLPRYRSVEASIAEIEETVNKMPVRRVFITDDIFGIDKEWREEFCKEYAKRIAKPLICLLRVNLASEKFMKLLKEAGCYHISMAIESGNDYVRNKIMNRQISEKQIIDAFALAHKYGIQTNAINIIGVPGETEEMIWDTIKLNRQIKPTSSGINIFYPYLGTVLGDQCFKEGLIDLGKYNSFSNERRDTVLNFPEDFCRKLQYFQKNWADLVYPYDIKRRFMRFFMRTPLWRILRAMKYGMIKGLHFIGLR